MTARGKKQSSTETALAADGGGFSLISREKLLLFYATMLKCRMLKERILKEPKRTFLQQIKALGYDCAARDQEALQVGVASDLLLDDVIVLSPRDFILDCALHFLKGMPLESILHRILARPAPAGTSTFAAQLQAAIGLALANKTKRNGRIVTLFFGEAITLPDFRSDALCDAMLVASAHQLPMIFVRTGASPPAAANTPSLNEDRSRDRTVIAAKAEEYGLPFIIVDGNDVVAVYRVASESIARARRGRGPTLIECGSGALPDLSQARRDEDSARKSADDPILKMERYLRQKNLFSEAWGQEIAARFDRELNSGIGSRLARTGYRRGRSANPC